MTQAFVPRCILVTGGAGFIGSNFVHVALNDQPGLKVVNLDKLTYAGNLANLADLKDNPHHVFVRGDVADAALVGRLLQEHQPQALIHFAAESHVDRSIHGPADFLQTNVMGTFNLLECVRAYVQTQAAGGFRYVQVSTDEVYGSLEPDAAPFTELHRFEPNSPYSATKAAADHLARAWHHTYGLPVLTTNCSNNYGPYHFPEKLIPLVLHRALQGMPLPIYGDGLQVRDWLYVEDHCRAIWRVVQAGVLGETYNIGGWNEMTNLDVVRTLCATLDEFKPRADGRSYATQMTFVADRPGHDRRYAIDARKIERDLGWRPQETFQSGIRKTVRWYLDHPDWVHDVTSGAYRDWVTRQYG
jgi:dTDP-glucose 4,6-dehydratase